MPRPRWAGPSTSCTPASGHSAGSPTCGGGPAWWRRSCAPAGSSTSPIHPFATLFADGEQHIAYPYLEHEDPLVFDEPGTYADRGARTEHNRTTEWSHGLGEVVSALIDAGLVLEHLRERVEIFYDFTGWLVERTPGVWAAPDGELPLLYSLRARKPAG